MFDVNNCLGIEQIKRISIKWKSKFVIQKILKQYFVQHITLHHRTNNSCQFWANIIITNGERQCGPTLWETTCKLIFENEYKKSTKIGKGWKEIFKFYGFKAADEVVFEFVDLGKCFCEVYNG